MAKKQPPTCPVCDAGTLKAHRYSDELEYRGRTLKVDDLECWLCPACSADPIFPDQARRNHARYQDARRKSCGLLTGDEIAAIRSEEHTSELQSRGHLVCRLLLLQRKTNTDTSQSFSPPTRT